jgi:hypothetical protein
MVRTGIIVVLLLINGCTSSYIKSPEVDPNPSSDPVLGARGKVNRPPTIQYHRGNTIERVIQ